MVPALHLNFTQWERVAGLTGMLLGAHCVCLYTVLLLSGCGVRGARMKMQPHYRPSESAYCLVIL